MVCVSVTEEAGHRKDGLLSFASSFTSSFIQRHRSSVMV